MFAYLYDFRTNLFLPFKYSLSIFLLKQYEIHVMLSVQEDVLRSFYLTVRMSLSNRNEALQLDQFWPEMICDWLKKPLQRSMRQQGNMIYRLSKRRSQHMVWFRKICEARYPHDVSRITAQPQSCGSTTCLMDFCPPKMTMSWEVFR